MTRTRSRAAALVRNGNIRINRAKTARPGSPVRPGDVLTVAIASRVRVLRVTALAKRRGSPTDAATLFEELTTSRHGSNATP